MRGQKKTGGKSKKGHYTKRVCVCLCEYVHECVCLSVCVSVISFSPFFPGVYLKERLLRKGEKGERSN
jgi:hypothetical protein